MSIRRQGRRTLAAAIALLMSGAAWADPIPGLYNTGLDASNNRIGPNGQQDAHYQVEGHSPVTYYNGAYFPISDGQWIASLPDGNYSAPLGAGGARISYTLNFNLTGYNPSTAHITGKWATDNEGILYLNGVEVQRNTAQFNSLTSFDLSYGFQPGLNTLTFVVIDYGPPGALAVSGLSGTVNRSLPNAWATENWSAWSTTCGSAYRTRTAYCYSQDYGSRLPDSSCQSSTRPTEYETSYQTSSCTFTWETGAFGAPASACGATTSSRTVTCKRSDGQTVADAQCTDTKPATTQPATNYDSCSYSWAADAYGAPTTTCGTATQTRSVYCRRSNGDTVPDAQCGNAGTRPDTTTSSYQTSGCSYQWNAGPYGSPAPACGATTSSRTVTCQRSDVATVPDAQCSGTKPATSQPATSYDTCSYAWVADAYGAPTTTCGQATQTRSVYCRRSNGDTVADAQCAGARPDTTMSSYQTSGCGYSWKASDSWDGPVPACGTTVENRSVTCLRSDGQSVADVQCDSSTRPAAQRAATSYATCGYAWQTTPWSDPSRTCGTSTRTRGVTCARSDGTTVTDASCTTTKPESTETIADYSTCTYAWTYSEYGQPAPACGDTVSTRTAKCTRQDGTEVDGALCGAQEDLSKPSTDYSRCTFNWRASDWTTTPSCGTTTRTRTVTCIRSDWSTVPDDQCSGIRKPNASEQVEDTTSCTYAWRYSDWTAPASCGAVVQTRTADCVRQDGTQVSDALCTTPRAETERAGTDYSTCSHSWTTGAWSTPSACGATTRTRSVTCTRSDGTTVGDDQCGQDKPAASERTTDTSACQFSWVQTSVGAWSACTNGSQSRPVTAECRRSDGSVVADTLCPTSRPPVSENRACTSTVTPANPGTPVTGGQIIFRRAIQVRPQ